MRKFISIAGTVLLLLPVAYWICSGAISVSEFVAILTAFLVPAAVGVLVWGFKPEINHLIKGRKQKLDPRFDHVEARLFYPSEISYEKGERVPEKNNPRKKLLPNTITKKAYYVDDIYWEMIRDHKIRSHSEDDQDLKKWCNKKGYELVDGGRDVRDVDLLEIRTAKSTIEEKKQASQLADIAIVNSPRREAVDDLLEKLYFFINNWNVYRNAIQARNLTSPQNGEVKWASDQIKSAIVKIRLLKLRKINEKTLILVESTANNMAKLGMSILETYPSKGYAPAGIESITIDGLVKRGDSLCENTKQTIRKVSELL